MNSLFQPAAIAALLLFPSLSSADRLSADWQSQRDRYNAMTDRICEGDAAALQDLSNAAWLLDNPVALHNLAWLYSNQDSCPTAQMGLRYDAEAAIDAQQGSAHGGYPVGEFGYAMMLIEGQHGFPKDPERGVEWLDTARSNGFAGASEELALIFSQGLYGFPQEAPLARLLVQDAEDLGLSATRLAQLRNDVEYYLANVNGPSAADLADPIFEVVIQSGQDHPKMGDRSNAGSYFNEVVYVAQAFEISPDQGGCWRATSDFMIGQARVALTTDAADRFDMLLEMADTHRANSYSTYVEDFASLNEGIRFRIEDSGSLSDTGQIRWSVSDAQAMAPQCSGAQPQVLYPSPLRAGGY